MTRQHYEAVGIHPPISSVAEIIRMAHLVWSEDLNTGIDVIDAQHRQIVGFINQLDDARSKGDRKLVKDVLDGLIDYTVAHFSFEETLMEDVGYAYLRPHQKVHEQFVRRVSDMRDQFERGEEVVDALHSLLHRWLFNHIRHDDDSYAKTVKGRMQKLLEDRQQGGWLSRTVSRFFRR